MLRGPLAAFTLVCASVHGAAAHAPKPLSQYLHEEWGSEKGFPGGPINVIAQTSDGYLWIGAQKGLVRFDGRNFRLFSQVGPNNSSFGPVLGLVPDREGNLWVRLQGPGLLRYHDGTFNDFSNTFDHTEIAVTQMGRAPSGHAIFATILNGILTYDHGKFLSIARQPGLPNFIPTSVAPGSDGSYWVGTRDLGLFQVRDGKYSAVHDASTEPQINVLLSASESRLWIGTDKGLFSWSDQQPTHIGLTTSLRERQILSLAQDGAGDIWVGTDHGVYRLDPESNFTPESEDILGNDFVPAVFVDREGNIWTATRNGLQRLRNTIFTSYSAAEGLPGEGSGPVHVDADGRTWFAPMQGGLYWVKDTRIGAIHEAGLDKDIVYSIAGNNGDLWVARQRGGLTHLHRVEGKWQSTTYTAGNGLAQNSVYTVRITRSGTVWAGTLSAGLTRIRNGKLDTLTTANGLISNTISSILEGRDGTMWFATPRGLSAFSNNHWRSYSSKDGLPSDDVNCLFEDSQGTLWVGTMKGLAALTSGQGLTPSQGSDILREPIFGIQQDTNGFLWISTSNHVASVHREKLLGNDFNEADIRLFGLADGLHNTDGVKRDEAVASDNSGKVWFSLTRGLSVVDTSLLRTEAPASILHLDGLFVDGNPLLWQSSAHISPHPKRITFNYAGISLSVPDRVRFKYKLDGFDQGWSDPLATQEASYTNLNPGSYLFHVMATNSDGLWNGSELTVPFTIERAWWQTAWFTMSCLTLTLVAIWLAHRYRLHRVTQQLNVRLEARVNERTRIARELHDSLLQNVQGLILKFDAVARTMSKEDPTRQAIEKTLDHADQVLAEGRERVRTLRVGTVAFGELPSAFHRVADEAAPNRTSTFKTVVEGRVLELHPIIREESYSIGREAIINALTHSEGLNIEVEIAYDPRQFRLRIRDDGRGIDPAVLEKGGRADHWGLQGMRERATRIGARLELWSRPGAGTEIELMIPGGTAYQGSRAKSKRWARWFAASNGDQR